MPQTLLETRHQILGSNCYNLTCTWIPGNWSGIQFHGSWCGFHWDDRSNYIILLTEPRQFESKAVLDWKNMSKYGQGSLQNQFIDVSIFRFMFPSLPTWYCLLPFHFTFDLILLTLVDYYRWITFIQLFTLQCEPHTCKCQSGLNKTQPNLT